MSKRAQVALAACLIAVVGVLIGQLLPHPLAEAQQGPRQWRECISASLWHHNGADMANPAFRPRSVRVPAGWVPVGGGGQEGGFAVVLCR